MSTVRKLADGGETNHGLTISESRLELIKACQELFCSRVTPQILKKYWNKDAIFEDPICIATNVEQYAAQWYSMPKAFPKSVSEAWITITNEPKLLEFENRQNYTVAGLGVTKVMYSIVSIELDENEKITKLVDKWNGSEMPSGAIAKSLRRLNGRTVPKLVAVPKEVLE